MKPTMTLFLIVLTTLNSLCQDYKMKKFGHETFIDFSVETLIQTFNMSVSDWEKVMNNSGYDKLEEEEDLIIFSKGEVGSYTQMVSKNTDGVLSIDWYDFVSRKRSFDNIEKQINSSFVQESDKIKFYSYGKYIIGIESYNDDNYCFDRILIRLQ